MMKNKITLLLLIAGFVGIPFLQSCKKYEEGPLLSLRSRSERVANTWKVENYKKNGTDLTSLMAGYTETYTKGGNYTYAIGSIDGEGTWAFQNNDKEIKLTGTRNQSTYTLIILKLEEKAFWYYYMDDGNKKEFHMIEN